MTSTLTKIDTFQPTPLMRLWVDVAITLLSDSPTEIAHYCKEELNMRTSRQSWYDWAKSEDFLDWFYSEYKRGRSRLIPTLDGIALKMARRGSFKHWKALNDKVDPIA